MSLFIEVNVGDVGEQVKNILISLEKISYIEKRYAGYGSGCVLHLTDGKEFAVTDAYEKFADQYAIRKVTAEDIKKRFPKTGEVPHHPV
jgi:hypothetical protein